MKKFLLLAFLLVGAGSHAEDPAVTHGMLFFGHDKIYLSHLPMFNSLHGYQVIFEATLSEEDKAIYEKDTAANPKTYYTIAPEKFVLPEMIAHPRNFTALLFRGHFERDGVELKQITIQNPKIVFVKKLDPKEATTEPQFLSLGTAAKPFLVHLIQGKPNFDQILVGKQQPVAGTPTPQTLVFKELYKETGDLSD